MACSAVRGLSYLGPYAEAWLEVRTMSLRRQKRCAEAHGWVCQGSAEAVGDESAWQAQCLEAAWTRVHSRLREMIACVAGAVGWRLPGFICWGSVEAPG